VAQDANKGDLAGEVATVLVIDDDIRMLSAVRRILEHAGYHVLVAEDGRQGIQILREQAGGIDAIILDWILPSMSGAEWLEHILEIDPDARVVFFTGHLIPEALHVELEGKVRGFLHKPFTADQLLGAVVEALG